MCVRTLIGSDSLTGDEVTGQLEDESSKLQQQQQQQNKLTKAKEKYMKLHDEMIDREMEEALRLKKEKELYEPEMNTDFLAVSTIGYSIFLNTLSKCNAAWQQSNAYKILYHTTQPAHVITIAAVLCVTSALVPTSERANIAGHPHSRATSFIYLASFVMHFGAQIWMTFVSGLTLYFSLPRHTFGEVQRQLFPKYFTINACLSLTTLLIFIKHHPAHTWDTEIAIQVGGMLGAFFLELLIRLYLTPPLLQLIVHKNALERAAGVGTEIGRHNPGPLKHCPHYMKIHHAFRRVHVCIAMGNMLTMACTVLHLHYIASKLCVL